jgi:hypothetical protein
MTTITKGTYGANIRPRNDGEGFDVFFLYNSRDVHSRKTFKTMKTAEAKVAAYFKMQGAA